MCNFRNGVPHKLASVGESACESFRETKATRHMGRAIGLCIKQFRVRH